MKGSRSDALKVLMLVVLALFAGEYVVRIVTRIHGVIYILVAAVFLAYLIYPAVARLDLPSWVETRGLQTAGPIVVVLAGTAAAVAMFIIVPMVTAYLLLDLDHPKRSLAAVVPEERWRATVSLLSALVVGVLITGALTPLLLVGADLGGLFGMLVAVPVAAKAS
jgi:predicted PurR-regulated permease PerM